MLNLFNFLRRPEYVLRPVQVLRRLNRIGTSPGSRESVLLPWGARVAVDPKENIGSDIYYYGIFDKIVPETIWRLLEPGELAIEVGANLGQNCSLMAVRTGPSGRVIAFEPHPEIFNELKTNANEWKHLDLGSLDLQQIALGGENGTATLTTDEEFHRNRGSASVHAEATPGGIPIAIQRLDSILPTETKVGVCKIDVEGHELAVLAGSERLLRQGEIRDIVFEDFHPQPSAVTSHLRALGYTVFRLRSRWLKPELLPIDSTDADTNSSHNFLATIEPERAAEKFRPMGWLCFGSLSQRFFGR